MPKLKIDKETLVKKSLHVFRKRGYHHTSIADLAEACGVEKPHFYYYFKDKQDIMKEVLVFTHFLIRQKILAVADNKELTSKERLDIMLSHTLAINTLNNSGCLMGNMVLETADSDPDFKPVLQEYFKNWINSFEKIYSESQPAETARMNAEASLKELQGGILLMRLFGDQKYLVGAIENIKKKL